MKNFQSFSTENQPITTILFQTGGDNTTITSSNGVEYSLPFVNYRAYKAQNKQQLIQLVNDLVFREGQITHITIHIDTFQAIYHEYCQIRNKNPLELEKEPIWLQIEGKTLAEFQTWIYIISKHELQQEGENKNPDDMVGFEQNQDHVSDLKDNIKVDQEFIDAFMPKDDSLSEGNIPLTEDKFISPTRLNWLMSPNHSITKTNKS